MANNKPLKFILISGHAGAGKDTFADILVETLTKKCYTVLKTHYADLLKYVCEKYLGWDGKKDKYGRTILQTVGTDIVRRKNPNFWVDFILTCVAPLNMWDFIIIPDTRFPNEISRVKEEGYDVMHINIIRPNNNILTFEQSNHASETSLNDVSPDYTLVNDGSIADLKQHIANIFDCWTLKTF